MEFIDNRAIYLQIADHVFEQILLKRWSVGERIPSVRELAATLEVNPNTIARSYELMQNQGIIQNKRGIGFFVEEAAWDKIRSIRKNEFMEKDVPAFFKSLYLLEMDFETLKELYERFKHQKIADHENK